MERKEDPGLSRDSDYQISVQRTIDFPLERVWDFLISKEGLIIWLGSNTFDKWETGIKFITKDGIKGKVRVFKIYSLIRLSWKMAGWDNESILQVRIIEFASKTVLSFHQEGLQDQQQRTQMKQYWLIIIEEIAAALESYRAVQ